MPFAQWHNNKVLFSFWGGKKKRLTLYIKYYRNQAVTSTHGSCLLPHLCQMSPFLSGVWSRYWIWGSMPYCTACNISLCAFQSQILSHFPSCILIQRFVSLFPWIANHLAANILLWHCRSRQLKRTVTSSWKIECLVKTAPGTGPQTCHPDMKDLFSITIPSLMWGHPGGRGRDSDHCFF